MFWGYHHLRKHPVYVPYVIGTLRLIVPTEVESRLIVTRSDASGFCRVALKRKGVKYTRGQLHQVSFWLRLQLTNLYIEISMKSDVWYSFLGHSPLIEPMVNWRKSKFHSPFTSSGTIGVGFSMNLVSPVPRPPGMVLGWWPENPILFGPFSADFDWVCSECHDENGRVFSASKNHDFRPKLTINTSSSNMPYSTDLLSELVVKPGLEPSVQHTCKVELVERSSKLLGRSWDCSSSADFRPQWKDSAGRKVKTMKPIAPLFQPPNLCDGKQLGKQQYVLWPKVLNVTKQDLNSFYRLYSLQYSCWNPIYKCHFGINKNCWWYHTISKFWISLFHWLWKQPLQTAHRDLDNQVRKSSTSSRKTHNKNPPKEGTLEATNKTHGKKKRLKNTLKIIHNCG